MAPLGKEGDSKYFATQKKGEMHELRLELHSTDRAVKVDAVKKVIASMTVGKDVSMLFTDVLNCVQTGNIELKKLVYLYLINVRVLSSLNRCLHCSLLFRAVDWCISARGENQSRCSHHCRPLTRSV